MKEVWSQPVQLNKHFAYPEQELDLKLLQNYIQYSSGCLL